MICYTVNNIDEIFCPFCGCQISPSINTEMCIHSIIISLSDMIHFFETEDNSLKELIKNFDELNEKGEIEITPYQYFKDFFDDSFLIIQQRYPDKNNFQYVIFKNSNSMEKN